MGPIYDIFVLMLNMLFLLKVKKKVLGLWDHHTFVRVCLCVCVEVGGGEGNSMFVYSSSYTFYQPYAKGGHSQRSIFWFHGNNNVAEARTCEAGPTIASTPLTL
jgi:hypothetical protein